MCDKAFRDKRAGHTPWCAARPLVTRSDAQRAGETIDLHAYLDDAIDVHHIFPQRWCAANAITDSVATSVVNKTAIDARTNHRIGSRAPSKYLSTIESQDRIDSATLELPLLRKQDRDGWELWLTDLVSATLGKVAAAGLEVQLGALEGGTVARIDVGPAAKPVFATPPKGEKKQVFLVRINNSTQELGGQEALDY